VARLQGLGEEHVALIDADFASSSLPERYKAVIRFTDAFLLDPSARRAPWRDALAVHLDPRQVAELALSVALFMGFSKIAIVLGTDPRDMPTTVVPTPEIPT
jgi:alkylhydroperoxidase family enzyme